VAYLTGWLYRKGLVTKNISFSITNYQVKLLVGESYMAAGADVVCDGFCASDFRDLRFTTADGVTLLDYWIESITGTTPNQLATIWVELDFINTVDTIFYMYYGNPAATAVSNGDNTFLWFDDSGSIKETSYFAGNIAVRTKASHVAGTNYNGLYLVDFDSSEVIDSVYVSAQSRWQITKDNWNSYTTFSTTDIKFGTSHVYELFRVLAGTAIAGGTMDGAYVGNTTNVGYIPTSDLKGAVSATSTISWLLIRQFVYNEPVVLPIPIDYASNINISSYPYSRPLIVTETTGQDKHNSLIRVYLNSINFNFYYARQDGKDFRVAVGSNGSGVLNMFIASWDYANKKAYLMFKLPFLPAHSTTVLWAFWGNPNDVGISSLNSISDLFIFHDDFIFLDINKWAVTGGYTMTNSRLGLSNNASFQAKGTPLKGLNSFIVEEGIYASATTAPGSIAHAVYFYTGSEYTIEEHGHNAFGLRMYLEGTTDRNHNAIDSVNYITYADTNKGFASGAFNNLCISYWEETDKVYQGLKSRPNLADYEDSWERAVLGNTDLEYFILQSSDGSNYIDWITVRSYDLDTAPTVNAESLYVEFQIIPPQPLDFIAYGDDLSDTVYYHQTNISGADPYTMSDSLVDNISNIFESDILTTLSGYVYIDFGRYKEDFSDEYLVHYDNNHVLYYNASKLSYEDDESNRNYWLCTTSSGVWAAIDFGPAGKKLGSLGVKAVANNLNGMIKDFKFYGCHVNPINAVSSDKITLKSGTFIKTTEWQSVYFANQTPYRYYILEATNSYGANVALQEWRLLEYALELKKRSVKQFRLHPASFESNDFYFPKYIQLHGSSNGVDWTSIMSANTYTPFYEQTYGRWQVYSFSNPDAYYIYRLTCSGNWGGAAAQIKMGEWEFYEYASEINTYRVLDGTTNNIANVWLIDNVLYAANDKLSSVIDDGLAWSTTISGVADFIVRG
jgi:hypothetical protein